MSMFSEANISPTEGTELLQALGLDAWELQKPDVLRRFLDVAKYFEKFPDGVEIARLVARNALKGEKLDKVYEYMGLRESLDSVRKIIAEQPTDNTVSAETPELLNLKAEEARLMSEIRLYE